MEKLDLLILAGAGAIVATAGGLWFNHTQASTGDSAALPDGREVRISYPEGRAQGGTAHIEVVDPKADADPATQALLSAAGRLQAEPCSASAKSAYLAALRAYVRDGQRKAEAARGGTEEARFSAMMSEMSSANQQAFETTERLQNEGFVFRKEHQDALRAAAPEIYSGRASEDEEQESTHSGLTPACESSRKG